MYVPVQSLRNQYNNSANYRICLFQFHIWVSHKSLCSKSTGIVNSLWNGSRPDFHLLIDFYMLLHWYHRMLQVPGYIIHSSPVHNTTQNDGMVPFFPEQDYSNRHRYREEVLRESLSHMVNMGLQVSSFLRPDFAFKHWEETKQGVLIFIGINSINLLIICLWPLWLHTLVDSLRVHCVLLTISLALCGSDLPGYYSDWLFIMIIVTTLLFIDVCLHLASIILAFSSFLSFIYNFIRASSTISPSLQRTATTECLIYAGGPLVRAFFTVLVNGEFCGVLSGTWLADGFPTSHSTSTPACPPLWTFQSLLSPCVMEVLVFLVSVGHSVFQASKSHSSSMLILSPASLTGIKSCINGQYFQINNFFLSKFMFYVHSPNPTYPTLM